MNRWLNRQCGCGYTPGLAADVGTDEGEFDEFKGKVHFQDLAALDGNIENFEGREWLESRAKECLPVSWSIQWTPDRTVASDHPVALMTFADDETAVLIRTHRTKNWLPGAIMRLLISERSKKICADFDSQARQKMQSSFDFQPGGIIDMTIIAQTKKGLTAQGLKALCDHFGVRLRRELRVSRSNWEVQALTTDQIRYAAEDAHFAYVVHEKLNEIEDVQIHFEDKSAGVLELLEGWSEQGIYRGHDGLYCKNCEQGPMTIHMNVHSHLGGKKHKAKIMQRDGVLDEAGEVAELPERYVQNSIIQGEGQGKLKIGEYMCELCNTGALMSLAAVDKHIAGDKHQKKMAPKLPPEPVEKKATAKDIIEAYLWNLPTYVKSNEDVAELVCTICGVKANNLLACFLHLNGTPHANKCRAQNKDEVIYDKDRGEYGRLSWLINGTAVVRDGFSKPRRQKSHKSATSHIAANPNEAVEAVEPTVEAGEPTTTNAATSGENSEDGVARVDASATALARTILAPGAHVKIQNLQNKPELNGRTGDCIRMLDTGRWEIRLDSGELLAFKPENLETQHKANGVRDVLENSEGNVARDDASVDASANEFLPVTNETVSCKKDGVERLPPGWVEYTDPTSLHSYYYHAQTGAAQWDRPIPDVTEATSLDHPAGDAREEGSSRVVPREDPKVAELNDNDKDDQGNEEESSGLPPGWIKARDSSTGCTYYADLQTQTSQWERPETLDIVRGWTRKHEVTTGQAYWECRKADLKFYEVDRSWCRYVDQAGSYYWSNETLHLRFWERDRS